MQLSRTLPANIDNVDKQVITLLGKEVKENPPMFSRFYRRMNTTKRFERSVLIAPFGDIPEKPEGEEYQTDLLLQGPTKDLYPIEWGLMFEVTETAEEDDLEDIIKQKAKWLMFSMRTVQEKQAALVLTNGFSTQTSIDGSPLFSTAHPLVRGGTARNRPANDADLSVTSLTQAFTDMDTDTKLESGQLVAPASGFYLVVAPANRFTAAQIVKSKNMPFEASNTVNPIPELDITVIVDPYLEDADAWFLVPKNKDQNGLIHLVRRPVHMPAPDTDARTGNRLYKLRARMAWDSLDWRNLYGNPGI